MNPFKGLLLILNQLGIKSIGSLSFHPMTLCYVDGFLLHCKYISSYQGGAFIDFYLMSAGGIVRSFFIDEA